MNRLPAPALPDFIARQLPPGIERYRVDVGGPHMHVMELGRGRPVLLLHGNPTWGFLYRKVAAALAGEPLRLIMPDAIGLGLSDKPTDPAVHQLDQHAAWMGRLVDELALDGVVLVMQDWGGPIGLRTFADRRDRVAGMVLLNTVVGPPRDGFKATAFHRFARLPVVSDVAFRTLGFPQNLLWASQGDRRSIRGDVARAYTWPLAGRDNNVAPLALARMVPDTMAHPSIPALRVCQQLIESFTGPRAIVWGDRDPVLGGVISWLQKLLPDAPVTRTQAGHFLQEEVPDEIAAAIRGVVTRVSELAPRGAS